MLITYKKFYIENIINIIILHLKFYILKKLVKQSGIYMLNYKHDNRIFYIGKPLDL